MRADRHNRCIRFVKTGSMQCTYIAVMNGERTEVAANQTSWKCRECGSIRWLATGVDPNVQAGSRPKRIAGK